MDEKNIGYEMLLGCKSNEDESNADLRPVTQLGFASRFSQEAEETNQTV